MDFFGEVTTDDMMDAWGVTLGDIYGIAPDEAPAVAPSEGHANSVSHLRPGPGGSPSSTHTSSGAPGSLPGTFATNDGEGPGGAEAPMPCQEPVNQELTPITPDDHYHSLDACQQYLKLYNSQYIMTHLDGQVVVLDFSRCTDLVPPELAAELSKISGVSDGLHSGEVITWRPSEFILMKKADVAIVPAYQLRGPGVAAQASGKPSGHEATGANGPQEKELIHYASKWLESKHAATATHGVTFSPSAPPAFQGALGAAGLVVGGKCNLYRGLNLLPTPTKGPLGDLILKHIFEVLAASRQDRFEYILNILSHLVQRPGVRLGVIPCFSGDPGCGKGVILRGLMEAWFGKHFQHLNSIEQLTARFNSFYAETTMIFCDELCPVDNPTLESKLKFLVTEPTVRVEAKFKNATTMPNHANVVVATNQAHAFNVEGSDRRWVFFECSGLRCGDHQYFDELHNAISSGGANEVLHCCMSRALPSHFQPSQLPPSMVGAKMEQKLLSMTQVQYFWYAHLLAASAGSWAPFVASAEIFEEFVEFNKTNSCGVAGAGKAAGRATSKVGFCMALNKLIPQPSSPLEGLRSSNRVKKRKTVGAYRQKRGISMPPLEQCRTYFQVFVMKTPHVPGNGLEMFDSNNSIAKLLTD